MDDRKILICPRTDDLASPLHPDSRRFKCAKCEKDVWALPANVAAGPKILCRQCATELIADLPVGYMVAFLPASILRSGKS